MNTVSKAAKEKKAQYQRAYRAKNTEKVRQERREYNARNREMKRQYDKEYAAKNKEKRYRVSTEWRKNNPQKWLAIRLKHRYGITPDQMLATMKKQNHSCAICGTANFNNRGRCLDVDHCHATGRVRGMLCSNCNAAIGLMKDNPSVLRAAATYLESWAC